ncbi:hypothetical protein, partial [Marinimicrobium alkaliphilum]|uniref:hypothetical protein n=1 Tax=Marinimicrobium alkaliphilum TaxID=2202654 RepID=UPI00130061AF
YVLHGPGDGPEGIFDDSSRTIALILPEEEIQSSIQEYQPRRRGSKAVSIVLYGEQLDLANIGASVLSTFDMSTLEKEIDEYTNHMRYYRMPNRWLLIDEHYELVALCGASGVTGEEIVSCDFRENIKGFGVQYSLRSENMELIEKFESFIAEKLDEWLR